jgi:enoyl-CoA hydratase/carnithine racemase
VAVAAARQLLWSMLGEPSPWEAHRADSRLIAALGASADVAEGVTAFLEKRPPRFPGVVSQDYPPVPPWPAPPPDLA